MHTYCFHLYLLYLVQILPIILVNIFILGGLFMKLLGTPLCILCEEAEKKLHAENIQYEYFNFTESIENLKWFTALRDSRPEFDLAKSDKRIGIPQRFLLLLRTIVFYSFPLLFF